MDWLSETWRFLTLKVWSHPGWTEATEVYWSRWFPKNHPGQIHFVFGWSFWKPPEAPANKIPVQFRQVLQLVRVHCRICQTCQTGWRWIQSFGLIPVFDLLLTSFTYAPSSSRGQQPFLLIGSLFSQLTHPVCAGKAETRRKTKQNNGIGLDLRQPTASSNTSTSGEEQKLKVLVEFVCLFVRTKWVARWRPGLLTSFPWWSHVEHNLWGSKFSILYLEIHGTLFQYKHIKNTSHWVL